MLLARIPCRARWFLLYLLLVVPLTPSRAQDTYDPSWYNPDRPYVKIGVAEDGVYQVTGGDLEAAGVSLSSIDPVTLRLFENGTEIPIHLPTSNGVLSADDAFAFVGKRNRGADEGWVYSNDPTLQSSAYFSLYSDTTYYWLTWGDLPGARYTPGSTSGSGTLLRSLPATLHLEEDNASLYFDGDGEPVIGNPLYTRGEGYYMAELRHADASPVQQDFAVPIDGIDRNSPTEVRIVARLNSRTASGHMAVLEVSRSAGGAPAEFVPLDSMQWGGYNFATLSGTLPHAQVPGGTELQVRIISRNTEAVNPSEIANILQVDYIEVEYTRSLKPGDGQHAFTVQSPGTYAFVASSAGASPVTVLNPAAARLFTLQSADTSFVDAVTSPTTYWVTSADAYLIPASVRLDHSSDLASPTNAADYIILTTAFLRPSAQEMASYRSSPEGGSHQVLLVDVQDVFDQFDYGRRRPIAIRRFLQTARSWAVPAEFLMLWGDALYPQRDRPAEPWEVPSFGKSSSDGWFSMQFDGPNDWTEEIHTGRIPTRTNEEGAQFVAKIRNYESRPLDDWMKRALILAGGSNTSQQQLLQNASTSWGDLVTQTPFGGEVTYYFKTADTVLDPTFKDSLQSSISAGTAWLGYFGHSSATTWEIITDPPEDFNNQNVLPVALSLGCYNGAFATESRVFAEDVVLKSLNGSIAHWGGTSSSFIGPARRIADPFYALVFNQTERILGRALTEAKRNYVTSDSGSLGISTNLQYNLVGDPATRIAMPSEPDLYVEPNLISITPFAPNPSNEELTVSVQVNNKGLVPDDSVTVKLTHWDPNNTATEYTKRVPPVALHETTSFVIPITEALVGSNQFRAEIDPLNEFTESDELNNIVEKTQIIFSTGLSLVYPTDQALVTNPLPTLRISLIEGTTNDLPIAFELDTSPAFDSPALASATVSAGVTVDWRPPSPLASGRTYYWRARVDDPAQPDEDWKTASFTVRTDLTGEGWFQQGALFDNNQQGSLIAHENGVWSFKSFNLDFGAAHGLYLSIGPQIYFRNLRGYSVIVVNGRTGEIRSSYNAPDPEAAMIDSLEVVVATAQRDDIVLAYNRTFFEGWGWNEDTPEAQRARAIFASIGSTAIQTLPYQEYWVMFNRIGSSSDVLEWVTPRSDEGLQRSVTHSFTFPESTTDSPLIGPAKAWDRVAWSGSLDNASSFISVDVLDASGEVLRSGTLNYPDQSQRIDLSDLSAETYPSLRLRATLSDTSQSSTPQLQNWYVRYSPIPELIMDPSKFVISADTTAEGETISVTTSITNLSPVFVDRSVVVFEVTDAQNNTRVVATDTLSLIVPLATVTSSAEFSTVGLPGLNRVAATVRQLGVQEQIIFNNLAVGELFVHADRTPPTFQVSIDGAIYPSDDRTITSTDDVTLPFISSRPTIEVVLKDENQYLALDDTSYITVTLDGVRLGFDRPDVRFEPGTLDKNQARVVFTPDFSSSDTTHTLRLWARDASGNVNPSELEPYQVHFRVQNVTEVENLYPYPNPMNSFTTFAFRLRASDPSTVEELRIRIYTLSGQLIREFDLIDDPSLLADGLLRIGWNKIPWDGTDADGDLVASGVYLYKVFLRAGGQSIPVNNQSSIEKLVVMR